MMTWTMTDTTLTGKATSCRLSLRQMAPQAQQYQYAGMMSLKTVTPAASLAA